MADKRSLVTSRLLTQQDSEEQKKKINDNNSELEVKDFFPSVLVSYEKKKVQRNFSKCGHQVQLCRQKKLLSSLLDYAICYDSNISLLVRACLIVRVIRVITFLK